MMLNPPRIYIETRRLVFENANGEIYHEKAMVASRYPAGEKKRKDEQMQEKEYSGVKMSLEEIAGGALQEKFNDALEKVLKNMQDPNTHWKLKRAITIKISFNQNEMRDDSSVDVAVDARLAPIVPISTRMFIGKDLSSGKVFVEEYGKQIKGQMSFSEVSSIAEKTVGDQVAKEEAEADAPKSANKIIDLRKAQGE